MSDGSLSYQRCPAEEMALEEKMRRHVLKHAVMVSYRKIIVYRSTRKLGAGVVELWFACAGPVRTDGAGKRKPRDYER
jgi:hypothetical protein